MTDEEKQGEVDPPEEIAAEDAVGAQETPTERRQEREQAIADEPVAESEQRIAEGAEPAPAEPDEAEVEFVEETPRVKPEIPGMDLEVDIVREGEEALRGEDEDEYGDTEGDAAEEEFTQPIADAAIDLAAGARYAATGKRKTAVARVTLKPGTGEYTINGRGLEAYFPRPALQRTIRTALETVGL
jgi:small subunit ribosomal protein S9